MVKNTKTTVKPVVHFVADGIVKEFFYNFLTFDSDDLDVYIGEDLQTANYSVTINEENGGKVVFNAAPPKGAIITIIRNLEIQRTSDFQESGAFRAKVINHELDYQVASLQQLDEKIGRTLVVPPYLTTPMNGNLPMPQAGRAIVWNAEGNALVNSNLQIDTAFLDIASSLETAKTYANNAEGEADRAMMQADAAAEFAITAQNWAENAQKNADTFNVPMIYKDASSFEDGIYTVNWSDTKDMFIMLDADLTIYSESDYIDFVLTPPDIREKTFMKRILIRTGLEPFTLSFDYAETECLILNGSIPEITEDSLYEVIITLVPTESSFTEGLEMVCQMLVTIGKFSYGV